MSITLGSVTLNEHVSWLGRYQESTKVGSEDITLGGTVVINRLSSGEIRDIVLQAIEEDNIRKGYFLKSQLDQLEIYRDDGTVVELNYHGEVFSVVIPLDGIQVTKALYQSVFDDTEKWIGTITLRRIV